MNVRAKLPTSVPELGQAPPSILFVDDSEEILEICQTMLEAGGYRVFTATSGTEALKILQEHPINAAIVDNIMPRMNGIDLAREIKRFASDVLVVMYSGTLLEDESFPFVDACLSKGKGPRALRKLLGLLLRK
jgi:CheY-like chemotaxis protein